MFLPVEQALPGRIVNDDGDEVWRLTFTPKNVDRWLVRLTVRFGPADADIRVIIEGQEDTIPIARGPNNALRFATGEIFIPQGAHVYVLWDIGTGRTPLAFMVTELATSRSWEELEQLR